MQSIQLAKIGDHAIKTSADHLEVNQFSGSISYLIPLDITPSRALTPQLALAYHSSVSKSYFGVGFDLSIAEISRSTRTGIPTYDDEKDPFSYNGKELVKIKEGMYQPRDEKDFDIIEFKKESDGNRYWIVRQADGINHIFGKKTKIQNPKQKSEVFTWLLEETYDAKGNRIVYQYKEDGAHYYLASIQYGNYDDQNFAFKIELEYQDRDDVSISYHSGFEIKTSRLCSRISLFHCFTEPTRVKSWALNYESDEKNPLSKLMSIQQYGYKNKETLKKSIPAIELKYTKFNPGAFSANSKLHSTDNEMKLENLSSFQFVDLYREGFPGILYNDGLCAYFLKNLGKGEFHQAVALENFPLDRYVNSSRTRWMEIPEADQMALFVGRKDSGGFYSSLGEEGWNHYQEFEHYSPNFLMPTTEFLDLNGNGSADMVLFDPFMPIYYPFLGAKGFDAPASLKLPEDFPLMHLVDPQEMISSENVFGDGLSHRVRVTKNGIECWPNLGYGKFGEKITLAQAPNFGDDFDPKRLHFASVAGSGAADLIYVSSDKIEIYLNQQGGRFATHPISIPLPDLYTDFDQIRFVDLFGKGRTCLIFSKLEIDSYKHYYFNFNPDQKPYLLNEINNGFGLTTTLRYTSSTQCYMDDLKKKRKPRYKCSFPVSVIESITKKDAISQVTLVDRYQFHDGYYDPIEQRFTGFGFVEHWDTDESEKKSTDAPTRYKKCWYHTGAKDEKAISTFYQTEYTHDLFLPENKQSGTFRLLPDSKIEGNPDKQSELFCQMMFAMQGKILREEIFDDTNKLLYTTQEYNYTIRAVNSSKNIFTVLPREVLSHEYEGNKNDPRIQHTINLAWDEYNHFLDSCTIDYPRRGTVNSTETNSYQTACDTIYPEQTEIKITGRAQIIKAKVMVADNFQFMGYPKEVKQFDVPANDSQTLLSFEKVKECYHLAKEDENNIVQQVRFFYCDEVPETKIKIPLLHQSATLVESENKLKEIYNETSFMEEMSKTGYLFDSKNYWNPSLIQEYDPNHFYLPIKTMSTEKDKNHPLWRQTEISYDKFFLVPTVIKQALVGIAAPIALMTVTEIDYRVVLPRKIVDANGNTSEILFDPLGVVVASSTYGTVKSKPMGNLPLDEKLLNELINLKPAKALTDLQSHIKTSGAGALFFYDWMSNAQNPTSHLLVVAEQFQRSAQFDLSKIQATITYQNGFGHDEQIKMKVDQEKWLVSQFILYNNKGLAAEEYLPFYSANSHFEAQAKTKISPKKMSFDALDRVIQTLSPAGFKTKIKFAAWYEQHFDENDTDLQSPHFDTPKIFLLNTLKQRFQSIEVLKSGNETALLRTRATFNRLNQVLSYQDPRLEKPNIIFKYDKQNQMLVESSVDHGDHIRLYDCYTNVIKMQDSRGYRTEWQRDHWNRTTHIFISHKKDASVAHLNQKIVYGESQNQIGRKIAHYDQTGVTWFDDYDIHEHPLTVTRQLLALTTLEALLKPVDWNKPQTLGEAFIRIGEYDAAGKLLRQKFPNQTELSAKYNLLEQLQSMNLNDKKIIEQVDYSETGQIKHMVYGNKTVTNYDYVQETQRLKKQTTKNPNGQDFIQDLSYEYDPVGNIIAIDDQSYKAFFTQTLPKDQYGYDSLYRLKTATGREKKSNNLLFFKEAKKPENQLSTYQKKYEYDDGSNLVQADEKKYRIADNSNRLIAEENSTEKKEFQHDESGNQKNLSNSLKLQYNWYDQLTYIENETEQYKEYAVYDAAGWQVRKITVEIKTQTIFEDINFKDYEVRRKLDFKTLAVLKETEQRKVRVHDGVKFVASYQQVLSDNNNDDYQLVYHLNNHLLSIGVELDEKGEVLTYEEYSPFGATSVLIGRDESAIKNKIYRYSGKAYDEKTGLYYYGARHYSPKLSRWTSPDPARLVDGLNVFAFVANNPIIYLDKGGLLLLGHWNIKDGTNPKLADGEPRSTHIKQILSDMKSEAEKNKEGFIFSLTEIEMSVTKDILKNIADTFDLEFDMLPVGGEKGAAEQIAVFWDSKVETGRKTRDEIPYVKSPKTFGDQKRGILVLPTQVGDQNMNIGVFHNTKPGGGADDHFADFDIAKSGIHVIIGDFNMKAGPTMSEGSMKSGRLEKGAEAKGKFTTFLEEEMKTEGTSEGGRLFDYATKGEPIPGHEIKIQNFINFSIYPALKGTFNKEIKGEKEKTIGSDHWPNYARITLKNLHTNVEHQ